MNQQPEKLFREKLENFQMNVAAGAWNRVEANLDKKNKGMLWLKIAASLLIVAIATFILWPPQASNTDNSNLADKSPKKQTPSNSDIGTKELTPIEHDKSEATQKTAQARRKNKKTSLPAVEKSANQLTNAVVEEKTVAQVELPPNEQPEIEEKFETVTDVVVPVASTVGKSSHITIVISAAEADEKYLAKNSSTDATSDEKKSSTLRKLLDTAYDLKYNQDPFGDLRQKKNEILALNFKSDKQRSQNK